MVINCLNWDLRDGGPRWGDGDWWGTRRDLGGQEGVRFVQVDGVAAEGDEVGVVGREMAVRGYCDRSSSLRSLSLMEASALLTSES